MKYCQLRNPKGVITIVPGGIAGGVRRLGNSPRNTLCGGELLLRLDRPMPGPVEHCARVRPHPERRHQVLKHSTGPGEQHWTTAIHGVSPRQQEPRLLWDLIFRDGDEGGSARLRSQEIVAIRMNVIDTVI